MSAPEKMELIESIWDSMPESLQPEEIPEEHVEGLRRRLARADSHPGEGKPWREVLDRLENSGTEQPRP